MKMRQVINRQVKKNGDTESSTAEVMPAVSDGTAANGNVRNGTATDGNATNRNVINKTANNENVNNRTANDGNVTNGTATDGNVLNRNVTNGTVDDGNVINGTATDRYVTNGTATDGAVTKEPVTSKNMCEITGVPHTQPEDPAETSTTQEDSVVEINKYGHTFQLLKGASKSSKFPNKTIMLN